MKKRIQIFITNEKIDEWKEEEKEVIEIEHSSRYEQKHFVRIRKKDSKIEYHGFPFIIRIIE